MSVRLEVRRWTSGQRPAGGEAVVLVRAGGGGTSEPRPQGCRSGGQVSEVAAVDSGEPVAPGVLIGADLMAW